MNLRTRVKICGITREQDAICAAGLGADSIGLMFHQPSSRVIDIEAALAIRRVIPAQMNMLIALQKDVALLSFIGPVEIFRQAGVFKSLLANFTPYVVAAAIFLVITVPATRLADHLIAKQNRARS